MSVLENMKSKVKEFTEPDGPGAEMLSSAKTSLAHGLDGASRFVDEKTNRKYSDTIHSGVGKAKEFLGDMPHEGSQGPGHAPAPGDTPPTPSTPSTPENSENPENPEKSGDPGSSAGPDGPEPSSNGSGPRD
jgi:hypothetical protein